MEAQYYGANCIRLYNKKVTIVIDDMDGTITKPGDVVLYTGTRGEQKVEAKITIDQPGEYEVSTVSVHGVAARAHMDEDGAKSATIYKIVGDDVRIAVVGHIYPNLSDAQLESIGVVDVLFVPVGGAGYTLDAIGAQKVIREIEPKMVIPTHYADKLVKYDVPQAELDFVLKELSMEPKDTVDKLKLKSGEISEILHLVVLENSR